MPFNVHQTLIVTVITTNRNKHCPFVAQVLLEPQEGLMGSVVIVAIMAAARWNVSGGVVAVVYQPPGAPPIQSSDTPLEDASAHGEVHPLVYRHRTIGVDSPAPFTAPSEGTCSNASNATTTVAPSAESRKGSIGSSFGGTGDAHGSVEADSWGRGAATGSLDVSTDQVPGKSEAQCSDSSNFLPGSHDSASANGCAADNCCQHDLPGAGSSGGQLHEQVRSNHGYVEARGLVIVDCSSSDASEDTQQCEGGFAARYEVAGTKPRGDVNADNTCSNHSSESYQERQASQQKKDNASVAEVASRHKPPGTVLQAAALHLISSLEHLRKPEELQPPVRMKQSCSMPASSSAADLFKGKKSSARLSDEMEPAPPQSRSKAPKDEAVLSKRENAKGNGGRLAASLQHAGMSVAGAWSSQAVDMLLSAGIVMGLTGVLISGIMMLVSS